ncbi:hypothetical protein ACROYT_G011772 [Oculina patagonica]
MHLQEIIQAVCKNRAVGAPPAKLQLQLPSSVPSGKNIADALSRLSFLTQKDRSGEETDAVKMIAEESTPMVLTAKEVPHEGHQGIVKMKSRLRTKVWWPKMDIGFCAPEPMQRVEPLTGPWQDVAIDELSLLPSGESLLVEVDYYSRFFEVSKSQSTTSQNMIEALTSIFVRCGYPFRLKCDNAAQFVSEEFEEFLSKNDIEHRKSPPFWPQANVRLNDKTELCLKCSK